MMKFVEYSESRHFIVASLLTFIALALVSCSSAKTGELVVKTEPGELALFIDDQQVGVSSNVSETPFSIQLKTGKYQFSAASNIGDEFQIYSEKEVFIGPDTSQTLSITLGNDRRLTDMGSKLLKSSKRECSQSKTPENCYYYYLHLVFGIGETKDIDKADALYQEFCGDRCFASDFETLSKAGEYKSSALTLLNLACSTDQGSACYKVAKYHDWNDKDRSPEFYEKACDLDHYRGCSDLATNLIIRDDAERHSDKILNAYNKACRAGSGFSCTSLAIAYMDGKIIEGKFKSAYSLLDKDCDKGNTRACELRDSFFSNSGGIVEAAELKLAYSFYSLAQILEWSSKPAQAVEHYINACGLKAMIACRNAARIYQRGTGVEKDDEKAKKIRKIACDLGDKVSCY